MIGELETELLSLQLIDLYARTFDDMLILPLAVRNDSNETDTSIRISIHIENESAECVQPDRNLINPEIRGEGECVGLEGIVYDEKLVEHFLKMIDIGARPREYAATTAHAKGMKAIGLTGAKDSKLKDMSDVCIKAPQTETYMIQELHLPIYHCLCLMLEDKFFT